jgi:hypothetical protein
MKLLLLQIGGAMHFAILIASTLTPRALDWPRNLAALHPFLRKLFWVYGVFIVLVIIGFGALTLLHARQMAAGDPLARALCGFIAVFWLARLIVQLFIFDARPFLTNAFFKIGYHALTAAFISLATIYGWVAIMPNEGRLP